jgi:hypothetical protein
MSTYRRIYNKLFLFLTVSKEQSLLCPISSITGFTFRIKDIHTNQEEQGWLQEV